MGVAMERRSFTGGAIETTLPFAISNTDLMINVVDSSTFPSSVSPQKPCVVVIDRGTVNEEKILISTISPGFLGAAQRGYDGTTAVAHAQNATVDHVLDSITIQDMNDTVYNSVILNWMGL